MDTITTLARGIAHDFNNLLMGIQGNVSLMYLNMDADHPHYKKLQNIEKKYLKRGRYHKAAPWFCQGRPISLHPDHNK